MASVFADGEILTICSVFASSDTASEVAEVAGPIMN
jgi:hypothetical protein